MLSPSSNHYDVFAEVTDQGIMVRMWIFARLRETWEAMNTMHIIYEIRISETEYLL